MNEVADFILRYNLIYNRWDRNMLLDWLQWHADHDMLFKAIDLGGSIAGVLIVRTIMKPEEANEPYAYDPEGGVAYIELGIGSEPGVIKALALAALEQFGERPWIAWKRPPYFVCKFRETKRVLGKLLGGLAHVQRR